MPIGWEIYSTRYHRPNVVSCEFITGIIQTPPVGVYLSLSILEHLQDLEEALKRFKGPIFLGDLNVDLDEARAPLSQRVTDILAEYSLIDLVHHFCQIRRFRNLKTWYQV